MNGLSRYDMRIGRSKTIRPQASDSGEPTDEADGPEGYSADELFEDACRIVLSTRRGSVSLLQRKLEIGYTRAARLIDMMAAEGIVGDYKGSKAREVVMSLDEWEARHKGAALSTPTIDDHMASLDAMADDDTAGD